MLSMSVGYFSSTLSANGGENVTVLVLANSFSSPAENEIKLRTAIALCIIDSKTNKVICPNLRGEEQEVGLVSGNATKFLNSLAAGELSEIPKVPLIDLRTADSALESCVPVVFIRPRALAKKDGTHEGSINFEHFFQTVLTWTSESKLDDRDLFKDTPEGVKELRKYLSRAVDDGGNENTEAALEAVFEKWVGVNVDDVRVRGEGVATFSLDKDNALSKVQTIYEFFSPLE